MWYLARFLWLCCWIDTIRCNYYSVVLMSYACNYAWQRLWNVITDHWKVFKILFMFCLQSSTDWIYIFLFSYLRVLRLFACNCGISEVVEYSSHCNVFDILLMCNAMTLSQISFCACVVMSRINKINKKDGAKNVSILLRQTLLAGRNIRISTFHEILFQLNFLTV